MKLYVVAVYANNQLDTNIMTTSEAARKWASERLGKPVTIPLDLSEVSIREHVG